ncbi:restriction endonuclease family protein [Lyngbya aestuarii BL J]|uniref:Restriction endonuclease family protein n=1 Tax=Lyngbya aestuarii BL J TaxID=1348334 RepID=U7QKK0_9CYAN|nr:Uma2 family endonuclease [Lyngbya aestuarii]ERT07640.1 restriction endonuclease family protein [Lyngbya aestuarii BL J]
MNTTTKQKLTFEEYLNYDDGTDNRYELEDGELIIVNPATFRHAFIIRFLTNIFEGQINQLSQPWITLSGIGVRTSVNRSRIPDICVIDREKISDLDVSAVMESAIIAVEIVSPESKTRDYRYKRSEYSVVGIPEYWIVDSTEQKVTVLSLVEGLYEQVEYKENDRIISPTFPELALTVEQVLQA